MASAETVAFLNIQQAGKYRLRVAREKVFQLNVCLYMHDPTPFRIEINTLLLNAISFGLYQRWMSLYTERPYLKRTPVESVEAKVLGNTHLMGGYQILLGGILISSIMFLLELISPKIKCLKRFFISINFWINKSICKVFEFFVSWQTDIWDKYYNAVVRKLLVLKLPTRIRHNCSVTSIKLLVERYEIPFSLILGRLLHILSFHQLEKKNQVPEKIYLKHFILTHQYFCKPSSVHQSFHQKVSYKTDRTVPQSSQLYSVSSTKSILRIPLDIPLKTLNSRSVL